MAITDRNLRVDTGRALTTAGTFQSTDSIDLTATARDVSAGGPLVFEANITTAHAGGTSIEFQIVQSANANLSSGTVVGSSGPIPLADLTLGRTIVVLANPRPTGKTGLRYIGMQYVVVGTFTGGAFTAGGVAESTGNWLPYASGFSV